MTKNVLILLLFKTRSNKKSVNGAFTYDVSSRGGRGFQNADKGEGVLALLTSAKILKFCNTNDVLKVNRKFCPIMRVYVESTKRCNTTLILQSSLYTIYDIVARA